jgi:hypothetical protein
MKARTALALTVVLLLACTLLSLSVWNRPDFLMTSDALMGPEFVWDALHHGYAWSGFQQSRVPSIFPDLLVFGVAQAATGSWRVAMAIWVFVVIGWLVAVASWIAADIARVGREAATLSVLLLVTLVLTAGDLGVLRIVPTIDADVFISPYLFTVMPITYGGPFLLALTAATVASRAAQQAASRRQTVGLALLSYAAGVSDMLCVTSLLIPLTAALLAGLSVGAVARKTAIRVLSAAWGGGAAGWLCTQMLNRQDVPFPSRYEIEWAVVRFPAHIVDRPAMLIVWGALAFALASDVWWRGARHWLGSFWSVFAAISALGSFAVTMLLYYDIWSYRYALPAFWWTVILAAAALARASDRRPMLLRLPVATIIAGLALARVVAGLHVPRMFVWTVPLASCLQNAGLRAGLADYWIARRISMASDLQLQIEQVSPTGEAYYWNNDRFWFTHDIHDGSRRPQYRFIVMDRLTTAQIVAAYGPPDHVMMCDSTAVWVYDDPRQLYRNLERTSPSLADTFATAPAE